MPEAVYVLGGWQSDFAERAADGLFGLLESAATGALTEAGMEPSDVEVAHVGNACGELFSFQAHLGGMLASVDPAFSGLPISRHEAACASGSMAVLGAMADIEAGRYDIALVVGADILRNVPGEQAAGLLQAHMWSEREAVGEQFPWVHQFGEISLEYEARYGVERQHLELIGEKNLANARRNPLAQTRSWDIPDDWFAADDRTNPRFHGLLRKHDCGRITDGSAAVVLASSTYAREFAARRRLPIGGFPRIKGWGHRTAPLLLASTLEQSRDEPYMFPHLRQTPIDALGRAQLTIDDMDAVELHDCFTLSEYIILDHLGLTAPGKVGQVLEDGLTQPDGPLPVNPSGGLLGTGHPVGATGIRMLWDAGKQVAHQAESYQVDDATNVLAINVGGSYTTIASFVVGTD